jgi:hypothetical protein
MANHNILTYGSDVAQVRQSYYAPQSTIATTGNPVTTLYCFLSWLDPWTDNISPPFPTQDQVYIKNVFKNMFVAKKINASNISPVTQRIDWTSGTIYDYYQDSIDMFQHDSSGLLVLHFYVKNKYDQVFKCLWNNNGGVATDEPFFQPGAYTSNNVFVSGIDGYKWKYLYTIDVGSKTKFMDSTWMPILASTGNVPNPLATAGKGSIDVVNVTNGGSGYNSSNSPITITITGDGEGATANAVVSSGVITDIIVYSPGSNYTYANVTITPSNSQIGTGASAFAPTSPVGGHSYDPVSELGCRNIMYSVEFNGSETLNGIKYIPTDISFHQVGLLVNPTDLNNYPNPATGAIYDLSTQFVVALGFGSYINDEIVQQIDINPTSATYNQVVFTGTVLNFDASSNVIKIINTKGTPSYNTPVTGLTSGCSRTLLSVSSPTFVNFSGYIAYIENRSAVQRSSDGIENFKFVLSY